MDNHSNSNFILTEDEATKNALVDAGFQLVQAVGGSWLFLNDNKKMTFANIENSENFMFAYTNKMMF